MELRVPGTWDDWDEAWGVAVEIRHADRRQGMQHDVTVRPVMISTGRRRARRVWGIFLISKPQENGTD